MSVAVLGVNPQLVCRDLRTSRPVVWVWKTGRFEDERKRRVWWWWSNKRENMRRSQEAASSLWQDLSMSRGGDDVVEMEEINNCEEFDQILEQAKHQPILIDWMAAWCRKCIYLKPKLEKLAAEYANKTKFYCVDVNKVPQALVRRGNISKMPTIQLWKDGEMKAEVIGGHKAWLVVDEVREIIEKFV